MSESKPLALVYEEPPAQVFKNAAAVAGITEEQARQAYGVLIADSAPTCPEGLEPEPLSLNRRAIQTMLALEGRAPNSGINTRWFGVRDPVKDAFIRGGFIRDRLY